MYSLMNFKVFTSVKFTLTFVTVITLFLISMYMLARNGIDSQMTQINSLKDLQLNKMDALLNHVERGAIIRQIVKESMKEMLQVKQHLSNKSSTKIFTEVSGQQTINPIFLQRLFHKGAESQRNHSVRNSKLEAFQIQTTMKERDMMYTLLEEFDKVMKKNNITYFMYGGTLLGSFRHHDLIPWDDDIDVILSLNHRDQMVTVFKTIEPDFVLYRAGGHDKFYHKSATKVSNHKWLWPYLDVSYYEENGTYIKDWIKTYGYWYYFPKEIVFPLHDRPLLNLSLPAPKDTFAFLTWTYNYGSSCVMYGYSHMVEGGGPSGRIDCTTLADKFPFVEHLPDDNGVREILKYKDLEIRNIVSNEPKYAVAETFKLTLKNGFKMPSNITPPPA